MRKEWQTKRLGEVCSFDKLQGAHKGLPYVGLEHIESHTGRFLGSTESQVVRSATFRFSEEHILYGRLRPYLNKVLAPDFEGHCSTEIFPIKPGAQITKRYLLYWLLSDDTVERINATCTGARMPRADMNEVLEFEFSFPSIPEQQRIVGILDEAFAGLATAKANAEKNLQNVRELYENLVRRIFSFHRKNWRTKKLIEVATFKNGLNYTRASKGATLPSVGVGNFQENFEVPMEALESVTIDGTLPDDYTLRRDDILTVRSNGSKNLVGRSMLVTYVSEPTSYSGFIIRIRITADDIAPRFLLHFMKSPETRDQLTRDGGGANISNINQTKLASLDVPLPSRAEQERVVKTLEAAYSHTQRLESLYQRKLTALDELRKSLLHQAFTGAL